MTEQQVMAIFVLAGIPVQRLAPIENQYWPKAYAEERKVDPWWTVITPVGLVVIGWRKRVVSINWGATKARVIVTDDNVTKSDAYVHASSLLKASEYLTRWWRLIYPLGNEFELPVASLQVDTPPRIKLRLPEYHDKQFWDEFPDVEGGCFNGTRFAGAMVAAIKAAGIEVIQ